MRHPPMRAHSVDLRKKKVVDAVRHGMPKAEVARVFGVGISSAKRYTKMSEKDGSLYPKKAPDKEGKLDGSAVKLLEEDTHAPDLPPPASRGPSSLSDSLV